MADSTCVMQSFARSSEQQQGGSIRALGESVSFGRFKTETLHWEKFSSFNENRYLEEAQSFSKPGLVAQKKAFFEAHFKKLGAGKTPNLVKATKNAVPFSKKEVACQNLGEACVGKTPNLVKDVVSDTKNDVLVQKNEVANENIGETCLYMESAKSKCGTSNNPAPSISDASSLDHKQDDPLKELLSGEENRHEKKNAVSDISYSDTLNNIHSAILVRTDELDNTSQNLKVCDQTSSLCDTRIIEHMVAEPKSFETVDSLDGLKSDQFQVEDNSSILTHVCQDKMVIQSTGESITRDNKPALISPNASSVGKLAVRSHTKPQPLSRSKKENNALDNTNTLESGMLNKKRITSKSLDPCLPVSERFPASKKSDSTKYPSNSASFQGSKEHLNQVFADSLSQKWQATSSKTLFTTRKSSAELHLRSAPPQPKKEITMAQKNRASMRNSVDIRKSIPKPLVRSINFHSRDGGKEAPIFSQRTGIKGVPALVRMTKTHSTHEPAKQVLSDTSNQQRIPPSNAAAFGRKSTTQFHAKPIPPLHPSGSRFTQSNSALTLSYIKKKESLPTSIQMSVDLSTNVRELKRPVIAQKSRNSTNAMPLVRVSSESFNPLKASLRKSIRSSAVLQLGGRSCPGTAVSLIRPSPPTAFTPFRFRSDERAAKRKEKLEEKLKLGAGNHLHRKEPTTIKKGSGNRKL